jgi:predicted O-methyltransferase YrrM
MTKSAHLLCDFAMRKGLFYSIWAYVKHVFTAWNTTGEGIHSPYLFELVHLVLRDENSYYCFADIERRREMLLHCDDELDVLDFGSQGATQGKHVIRKVCDIAKRHLESARVGQMLFRVVNFIGEHEKRPLEIVELGTSLGITTAYLATANGKNNIMTFEGSGEVLNVAKSVWKALKIENIKWKEGPIDSTLFDYARAKWDVAYVDANHTFDATIRYVDFLLPKMNEKGVVVIDDIHYSREMERAWRVLKNDKRVTTSMDLFHIGLLFVDRHYLKRHYRIFIG